jgi:hypothetical protein
MHMSNGVHFIKTTVFGEMGAFFLNRYTGR